MSTELIYDTITKTPMGDQASVLTLVIDGDTVSGNNVGEIGVTQVMEGKVDGNVLTWKTKISKPMPMTLEFEVTYSEEAINGSMKAGMFGKFALSGQRKL